MLILRPTRLVRNSCSLLSLLLVVTFTLLYKDTAIFLSRHRTPVDAGRALRWSGDNIARGQPGWQRLDSGSQAFVYAAHYDVAGRAPLVRVVAVAMDPLPFWVVTCRYYGFSRPSVVRRTAYGVMAHLRTRNFRNYLAAWVECPLDGLGGFLPYAVSVDKAIANDSLNYMVVNYGGGREDQDPVVLGFSGQESDAEPEVNPRRIRKSWSDFRWNVTRCFPAFQLDFNEHELLAEMVVIGRLLGVQYNVFYVQSAGPRVLAMLKVLQRYGDVQVLPWNLHLQEPDLYYAGQFASINDCLYRHQQTSRHLLFGDVDELFVPVRRSESLQDLLGRVFSENENCGTYLFLNVFFNLKWAPATRTPPSSFPSSLTMLTHTRRHMKVHNPEDRSKPAVDPRKVLTGSVHVVETLRPGFESCIMPPHEGLLHHYRYYDLPPRNEWIEDTRLWDFYDNVVQDTRQIFQEYQQELKRT